VVATYSAALLCTLLSDRQEVATNDELSRAIWSAMSSFPLERLVDGIVKLSLSSRACQPLLLHVMDTVELLMCYVEPGGSSFLELGSQRVESLVDTMRKTGVSVDAAADQNTSMLDEEEDTPQLSNVSRPGGSSTPSQAETLSFSGLDRSIRMAAATILGRMTSGPFASLDERSLQLQLHIHSALHGYVSGLGAEIVNHGASYNLNCRSVRLYSLLASLSKEFESQIASVLSNVDGSRRKQLQDRQQDLRKCERDVNEARMQARAYAAEKTKYKNAVRSQAVLLERDRAHIVKQASIRAEQLVKVHFSERAKAEARLEQVAGRANQAESLREEAERQAKASREAEEKAKDELQDALAKLEETQKALDERRDQEEDRKAEMEQARQELEDAREELEDLNARFECAQKELQQSKRELSGTKDAYGQLQDELEVVFSNLSALAQIYEIKESEVVSIVEQKDRAIQEARRQSEEEIQRAGELVENQTRLELENERLKKKLARAKEKLETERQKRHEDEARRKRSGPVSYINQLHKSSSSDRMERSDRKALSSRDNSRSHSSTSRDRSRSSRL
jgi:regulator of replication initiation timing